MNRRLGRYFHWKNHFYQDTKNMRYEARAEVFYGLVMFMTATKMKYKSSKASCLERRNSFSLFCSTT